MFQRIAALFQRSGISGRMTSVPRIWVVPLIFCLLGAILIYYLFIIQVVDGEAYLNEAEGQYVRSGASVFNRGTIFFTDKEGEAVSAATLKTVYTIAIDPTVLDDPQNVYQKLSAIIPLDEETFLKKAAKKGDRYEEVAKKVGKDIKEKIDALGIRGVITKRDKIRFYPAGNMASHVLGFVGYKGNELAGRYGLERYYEDTLSRDEETLYVNFFAEVFGDIKRSLFSPARERDGDVYTSIDPSVQSMLEDELEKIREKWDADSAGGIVMDPKTGEIYAMASKPDFDPNYFYKVNDTSVFINPLVEEVFEMGSIIKPLTMAAGIDAGVVTPETTYEDKGYVIFDGRRVENYDGRGRGVVPMQEVLNQSLNTGVAFVMQRLGKERFRDYFLALGLGEETGIDLPGEVSGLVGNLRSKRDIEYVTASFGQGIAMTPIETIRALAALANGGKLVTPHIVTRVDYKKGFSGKLVYNEGERVFSRETSETISRMLTKVVDNALLGGKVKMERYSIAAKTGTAQIAREDGRGYYTDRYLHSFFGYFPAFDARFIVFLYTVNPKGARYASQTLTYPFMDITKFLISYYDIPPDR